MGIRLIVFLFLHENICCGYSLEAPRRGASNEYPQHMFLLRNKKDISIFRMKKVPYLLLWCYHGMSYFSMKAYVVGIHKKRFAEALLMSNHNQNVHFYVEIKKYQYIHVLFI